MNETGRQRFWNWIETGEGKVIIICKALVIIALCQILYSCGKEIHTSLLSWGKW